MSTSTYRTIEINPSARRLTRSLRDVGYSFEAAVADIVDNSISAMADLIDVEIEFDGRNSWLRISDNGSGMSPKTINEALRFGSRRKYTTGDLGRFGLGLKTASLSQSQKITVATRAAANLRRIHVRSLDLAHIAAVDRWEVIEIPWRYAPARAVKDLQSRPGTVVLWEGLDRVLDYSNPNGAWARRRLERMRQSLAQYLGMVFHRYIDGEVPSRTPLKLTVNGSVVQSWDPFARSEPATVELPMRVFEISHRFGASKVAYRPYILPHRAAFSSSRSFEDHSGPNKWNRQQGLYVYRASRLIQSGGWSGLRSIDEHTKFARAAVEFDPILDREFRVNVAKMRVILPDGLKSLLERETAELCKAASLRYRRGAQEADHSAVSGRSDRKSELSHIGLALRAAAMESGDLPALERIVEVLNERSPNVRNQLQI